MTKRLANFSGERGEYGGWNRDTKSGVLETHAAYPETRTLPTSLALRAPRTPRTIHFSRRKPFVLEGRRTNMAKLDPTATGIPFRTPEQIEMHSAAAGAP